MNDGPPIVTLRNSGYEIVEIKEKRKGEWEIRYREKGSHGSNITTANRNSSGSSAAGGMTFRWK